MRRNKFVLKQRPQDSALDTFSHRYPSHPAWIPREPVGNLLAGAPATWLSPRLRWGLLVSLRTQLKLLYCENLLGYSSREDPAPLGPPWRTRVPWIAALCLHAPVPLHWDRDHFWIQALAASVIKECQWENCFIHTSPEKPPTCIARLRL